MRMNNQYIVDMVESRRELKAISSHAVRLPAPEIRGVELLILIMIRHPIRRILSVYDFERQQNSSTPGAEVAGKTTFKEYVKWRMSKGSGATIRNYFVLFLTQNSGLPPTVGPAHLAFAVDFVGGNHLTGLVEEFDKSAVLFEDYFESINKPLDFSYVRQNVGPRAATSAAADLDSIKNALGESLWTEVLEKNSLDIELYGIVRNLVDSRFSEVVDGQCKLENLRSRNMALI
jgi:hypothetical protein